MLTQALRLISAFIAGTLISLTVCGQRYPIRLDRHEKAGQKYHLIATSADKTTVDVQISDQVPTQTEDIVTVELAAEVTILEAPNNWATRKRFTVLRSRLTRAEKTGRILPNGTQVVASIQNGKTVYEVNQKLVDEEIAAALRSVIALHVASVADDDLFGTSTPKRVGERWAVSVDAMKKLLKEIGAQDGRPEITGSGTLEKVEKNLIFVRSSINVRDVLLPITPELTAESGEIKTELWGRFPLTRSGTEESNGKIYTSRVGSGLNADGKKVKVQVVYERLSRYEIRPLRH
jgi:hypothetical protein